MFTVVKQKIKCIKEQNDPESFASPLGWMLRNLSKYGRTNASGKARLKEFEATIGGIRVPIVVEPRLSP